MSSEKEKIVQATVLGFGLMLFSTIMLVSAQWVVDGVLGVPRISRGYAWVLGPLMLSMFIWVYTFLVYIDWSSRLKLSANELKTKMFQRAVLGSVSIIILIVSILAVPYIASMIDIGGPELPDSENWKPFFALWGSLGCFAVLCFVSVVWTVTQRIDRMMEA